MDLFRHAFFEQKAREDMMRKLFDREREECSVGGLVRWHRFVGNLIIVMAEYLKAGTLSAAITDITDDDEKFEAARFFICVFRSITEYGAFDDSERTLLIADLLKQVIDLMTFSARHHVLMKAAGL